MISLIELNKFTVQIIIETQGCTYKKNGVGCYMCNYGNGSLNIKDKIEDIENLLGTHNIVVISAYGPVLDTQELPLTFLERVLNRLNSYENIESIILETHISTMKKGILNHIQSILPSKKILIEFGLESSNNEILSKINKNTTIEKIAEAINVAKSFNYGVIANVLLGLPFMTTNERQLDCLKSITWAINHGVDEVVIFPCWIKPGTGLYNQYIKGEYNRVHHTELISLIENLPYNQLDKVQLSWYDNRHYIGNGFIPPYIEKQHEDRILEFYNKFTSNYSADYRTDLIDNIVNELHLSKNKCTLNE